MRNNEARMLDAVARDLVSPAHRPGPRFFDVATGQLNEIV
ncbi:hypothetical protein [Alloactinosynnema sp. L-07]|nr:hypothetical protein [Alloactinosynnema sp. L-07]